MSGLQTFVHGLEEGRGRFLFRLGPLVVAFGAILLFYDFSIYRGLDDVMSGARETPYAPSVVERKATLLQHLALERLHLGDRQAARHILAAGKRSQQQGKPDGA